MLLFLNILLITTSDRFSKGSSEPQFPIQMVLRCAVNVSVSVAPSFCLGQKLLSHFFKASTSETVFKPSHRSSKFIWLTEPFFFLVHCITVHVYASPQASIDNGLHSLSLLTPTNTLWSGPVKLLKIPTREETSSSTTSQHGWLYLPM